MAAANEAGARPEQLPALTAVRGIAAWWVVLYHFGAYMPVAPRSTAARIIDSGYLAVDLFFVLSGFVIALNYGRMFEQRGKRNFLRFIGFRLARIYPLHFVVCCLFLSVPATLWLHAGTPPAGYRPGYFALSLVLMQNWGFSGPVQWNVPAWSVSTELMAYLLFPALAAALGRMRRNRAAPIAAMLAIALVLGVAAWRNHGLGHNITTFGVVRCCLEFALGGCVFLASLQWSPGLRVLALFQFAALAAVAVTILGIVPDYVAIPLASAVLVFSLGFGTGWLSALLTWRPLLLAGGASFATYMIHYLVRAWVKMGLVGHGLAPAIPLCAYLGLTAAASVVLHRLVEVPGRVLGRRLALKLAGRASTAPPLPP